MSKEILAKMTCKELREVAKKYNISGRWGMTKDQLIEAIAEATKVVEETEQVQKNKEATPQKTDVCECDSAEAENKYGSKMDYIEKVEIGVIVAFRLPTGKVKAAKLMKRSIKKRLLKLETEYGAEFIVPFEDVIWVKTGRRWPRGIYNLLKGIKENEEGKKN